MWIVLIVLISFFTIYFISRLIKATSGGEIYIDKSVSLALLEGLNIPQGTKLICNVTNEMISLSNSDYEVNISINNIISIIKSEVEITEKGISFKNAIIGGVLFGEIGAAMGAFKGKENLKIDTVIISYENKDSEIEDITLM